MKFLLLLSVLVTSCVSISAIAATDVKKLDVNCDNVKININTRSSANFNLTASWVDTNVFPNPPKENSAGYLYPGNMQYFKFSCPNYSVYYDSDVIEIKAKTYKDIMAAIPSNSQKLNLRFMGYTFDLANLELKDSMVGLAYSRRFGDDDIFAMAPKTAVIGYKVDGSHLKPMLYNQTVSDYKMDLVKANKIDIYHKDDEVGSAKIQHRIHIDKPNGILRIYGNYPFPKN